MRYTAFFAVIVVMMFVSSSEAASNPQCVPKGGTCSIYKSEECCTRYCRGQKCIEFGESSDDAETKENPCNRIDCATGQICVLNQVLCIRAPCGPVGGCIKDPNNS